MDFFDLAVQSARAEFGKPRVTLCAWCPGARAETGRLVRFGYEVNHGICPACSQLVHAGMDAKVSDTA